MKIVIVVDMEGISGINDWRQVTGGFKEFDEHGRVQCTEDVNAAIRGLREGGAEEIRVVDDHGSGGPSANIIPEKLEKGVKLFQGPSLIARLADAVDDSIDAAVFIGFHAMADTKDAFMPHTRTLEPRIKINNKMVGETGLTAYYLGEHGIPVVMITGDQALVREASDLLPGIVSVQVKTSPNKSTSVCLPQAEAGKLIEKAATLAMEKIQDAKPLVVIRPIKVEISYRRKEYADLVEGIPRSERIAENTISYVAEEWDEVEDFINTASRLASQLRIFELLNELSKLEGFPAIQKSSFEKVVHDWLS